MKRFYAFGCSFTCYVWPTWADIIGKQSLEYQNWARPGSGNFYIFNSLNECIMRNKITKDDLVIIMWSSVSREDRYVKGDWIGQGNIYNQSLYDSNFVETLSDRRGYLLRDLNIISATKKLLDSIGVEYYFLSMIPIGYDELDEYQNHENTDLLEFYKDSLEIIRPSVFEIVFNNDWYVKDRKDLHPKPLEFLNYLDNILPEIPIQKETRDWTHEIDTLVTNKNPISKLWIREFPERF